MRLIQQLLLFHLSISIALSANNHSSKYTSKYAGQETRKIKSLSADDIEELTKGGGWGLAKAAELNGYPGPAHILEMGHMINLTQKQSIEIKKVFNKMQQDAIVLGKQLISLEDSLNKQFSNSTINQKLLEKLISEIASVRSKLRIVHLSTHLQTPKILTQNQIRLYNELRGYSKDPCTHIPEGHDGKMWLKHNDCK